jgi:sulfite reductase (NADPH) flavoprotein alpha-component
MTDQLIPCLPETAPFTAEQRAYLNGFLAGIFSRVPDQASPAAGPQAKPLIPLSILFGSQTGNAEKLAKRIVKEAGQNGFAPTIHDLAKYPLAQLGSEERLLIITSTYGDGEPPDNARTFWQHLESSASAKLANTRYSVCALGDSNYPQFCAFGKAIDDRLQALGASPVHPRVNCDVEYEEPFSRWIHGALAALHGDAKASVASQAVPASIAVITRPQQGGPPDAEVESGYTRKNPFPARLITNRRLNGATSDKDTRHFEIALEGSGLSYETGDALGVFPANCPQLVADLVSALKCSGEEPVPGREGRELSLREALLGHYEITKIPQPLLKNMAERTGDSLLQQLSAPGVNGELTKFLWGREIIDLLLAHPSVQFAPAEFIALLKKLQPRLYSISSSPKLHQGQVHLTVAVVRYESLARQRKGVCSTFLADRAGAEQPVPAFVHANKNFRPPSGPDTPMIMVGPGTGIAPFRAFLEERAAVGAKGRNWLFFGDRCAATDFLYRDELEVMQRQGTLTRLDTAFSRDQAEKLYVQQRMLEHAKELFAWLEQGAHFYVCGDASKMAKDVDAALHEIVQVAGNRTPDQAAEYIARLKSETRYQRDVY